MTIDTQSQTVFDAGLPTVTYHDCTEPDQAHRLIAQTRRQSPIALGPYGPEVLSYELVRIVLRDNRFVIPEGVGLAMQGISSGPVWDRVGRLIVSLNGDAHRRLRRLVSRAFTPRAAERMRAACVEVITELIDPHAATGHCDLVADIARPYPVPIICALLGAPRQDWQLFSALADDVSKAFGADVANQTPVIVRAWDQLDAYVEGLVAQRRGSLGDDLISELLRTEDDGDRLSHSELVNLVVVLLNAGTETTRNQLAAAVQVLCDHPDQWALLAADPDLAPRAVEELMRCYPIAIGAVRVAIEDVELGGVLIPAGTTVIANTAAANRDPAAFDDPDRLDITRDGAPAMLTFGGGVHYCLGAHLARVELTEALRVLPRRMPGLRRTGPAPWKPLLGISGPTTLPVEFDPATLQSCAPKPK